METIVKERPILFSGEMVRAIISGRKTQTRRIIKQKIVSNGIRFDRELGDILCHCDYLPPSMPMIETKHGLVGMCEGGMSLCPYGDVGDRLWVKEPWRTVASADRMNAKAIEAACLEAGYRKPWAPVEYSDGDRYNWDGLHDDPPGRYRHARFMPRWASRILLEVTEIRVERLQEITGDDVLEEGIGPDGLRRYYRDLRSGRIQDSSEFDGPDVDWDWESEWRTLWESINGPGSWDSNPWVWVVGFRRHTPDPLDGRA